MSSEFLISRRHLIGGLAVLPFVPAPALAASPLERIMVQGRPADTGSRYKFDNIMPALDRLGGVRRMRCREPYSGTLGWRTYLALAREGVRFCFTLSVRPVPQTIADLKAFLDAAPGSIWAIEFPNEPDLNPVHYKGMKDQRLGFRRGHAPALMAYIRDIRAALKADRTLRTIPLIASNSFMQTQQAPHCEFANTHYYPHPNANVYNKLTTFGTQIAQANHTYGVITEWGRTTGGGKKNKTSPPVSHVLQARLLASDISAALSRSYVHTVSIYELFSWGGKSEMNNFGLFNHDLSPRPAVAAIRSVIR